MEIKIGDHFIPLPDSPRYGPKRWRMEMRGNVRTWTEVELTPMDRLQSDLAGAGDFFDASPTITEADVQSNPAMKAYIGGRAVFPKRLPYPTGEGAKAERNDAESEWQRRSLEMHQNQQPLSKLEDKPDDAEGTGLYFPNLRRGD